MDKKTNRFWEIDFLRGLAIMMMIAFHFIYDLVYFGAYSFNIYSGFWWVFARTTAAIFIFLVGVSLTLSYSRVKGRTEKEIRVKYLARGLKIFGWGLIITLITWFYLRQGFIMFGVLHFIGLSIIIAKPFLKLRYLNLLLGMVFIAFGVYLKNLVVDFYWLIWFGLKPAYFYTLDYFPFIPWFGVILIGMFFGNFIYPEAKRKFKIPDISKSPFIKPFCFLGRNSLFIYLLHQPLLIAFLWLFIL